ncbi:hypothetical protein Tco_0424357 [Tanacetum coccineum]
MLIPKKRWRESYGCDWNLFLEDSMKLFRDNGDIGHGFSQLKQAYDGIDYKKRIAWESKAFNFVKLRIIKAKEQTKDGQVIVLTNSKEDVSSSACSGHFKKSGVPRTGGSILNLMDELVKVGQVKGYKMDGCMSNMTEIIESQGVKENELESEVSNVEIKRAVWDYGPINSLARMDSLLASIVDSGILLKMTSMMMSSISSHMFDLAKNGVSGFKAALDLREIDGKTLKNRFPRIYSLESCKLITVGAKLAQPSLEYSFRRNPRGGVEYDPFNEQSAFGS